MTRGYPCCVKFLAHNKRGNGLRHMTSPPYQAPLTFVFFFFLFFNAMFLYFNQLVFYNTVVLILSWVRSPLEAPKFCKAKMKKKWMLANMSTDEGHKKIEWLFCWFFPPVVSSVNMRHVN
jgi:hypothetical protein